MKELQSAWQLWRLCFFQTLLSLTLLSDIAHCLSTSTVPVHHQLQELQQFYTELQDGRQSRNILQRRHAKEFSETNEVFHTFARTVCQAIAVPRKELFETWAVALCVQSKFADCRRIADLAAGHGLLAWALLVLDLKDNSDDNEARSQRTAVCIDKRMPLSAEKVADAMIGQYPELKGCWDFVEGKLDAVTIRNNPNTAGGTYYSTYFDEDGETWLEQSTLLCGVHACGILSDQILSLAIHGNAPVVLLPCCHTKKSLDKEARNEYENSKPKLAEFVDGKRVKRLQIAGFDVEWTTSIPQQFTPQNSIIMASPSLKTQPRLLSTGYPTQHKHNLFPQLESIPVDDDDESRRVIRFMAGRAAAISRKQPSPQLALCVSISMPQDKKRHVKSEDLSVLADRLLCDQQAMALSTPEANSTPKVTRTSPSSIHVEYGDLEAFFHAKSGRYFRTFRITYSFDRNQSNALQKDIAKELHAQMCHELPVAFPGCILRS